MMTNEQLQQFKSNYCEMIIDGMDMNDLIQMCHDLLMDAYFSCTEEELKEEILDLYDDSVLNGIIGENEEKATVSNLNTKDGITTPW